MQKKQTLPGNFLVRHPGMDDLESVLAVINACDLADDGINLTGATRLYERAEMHIALQHYTYEKELRAGQELSTQSISL